MKKECFVLSLFLLLVLAACSKDNLKLDERIIYKGQPEITMSAEGDSLFIEGFATCKTIDRYKTIFPESMVEEFGLKKDTKYIYRLYRVEVDLNPKMTVSLPVVNGTCGFDTPEFQKRSCSLYAVTGDAGNTVYQLYTYFIHLDVEVGGENMDRWIPCRPDEIDWRCKVFDVED